MLRAHQVLLAITPERKFRLEGGLLIMSVKDVAGSWFDYDCLQRDSKSRSPDRAPSWRADNEIDFPAAGVAGFEASGAFFGYSLVSTMGWRQDGAISTTFVVTDRAGTTRSVVSVHALETDAAGRLMLVNDLRLDNGTGFKTFFVERQR
jgi:hypothetical protein